jgi:tetratricopeptide (TPR) repeat protein
MLLPSFYQQVDVLVGEDEPSNSLPSIDHNTDELPFSSLGGRRFEILAYLLELDGADEVYTVTLVQASGDKGRDLLVHRDGVLTRVIQCKNLLKKVGKPDLFLELVKLLLFDETEAFLPKTPITYELWAPRGFTEKADTLIAEWPNNVDAGEVLSAFQKVTSSYTTLEHFRWDSIGPKLVERLTTQFRLKRQDGITLSQRVRVNTSVYQRFFQAIVVMPQADVDLYLDKKLVPRLVQVVRMAAHEDKIYSGNVIDAEIDEAAGYINSNRFQAAESLLKRLRERHGAEFNHWQQYRVKANLGAAIFRLGRGEEAANFFLEAAVLEPDDERASTNEVLAHFLLSDDKKAFDLAAERRMRFPDSGRLLSIWITTAPADVPIEELELAVSERLRRDPEVNAALCHKLLIAGRLEAARSCALQAQESGPDWPQGYILGAHCAIGFTLLPPAIQQASTLKRSHAIDEGIIAATKARALAEAQSDLHVQAQALAARCELYLFAGDSRAARADAKQAYRLNPADVGNLLALAQTQLAENKIEVGISTLEQALDIQDRPDVCMMLSRALRVRGAAGDRERSVQLHEKQVLSSLPEMMRPPVAISVIQVLASDGTWERASTYLQEAREDLDVVTWQALSAYVLKGDGHPQDAEGRVSEALANLAPGTHLSTREFLARVLMNMGRLNEALPLYEELFAYETPAFDPMQLIECAGRLKRDQIVLNTFDELHRRTAVDWQLLEIEIHYLRKYHAAKAIDRLSAFLEKHPEHKLARLARSAIAWEMGRMDLLASRLQDLPEVGEMPVSYIRMALKLLSLGDDAEQTIDYAYRYLKLHFDNAEAHSALIFSVLFLPRGEEKDPNLPVVVEGAAVGYRELPNGPLRWTVLESTSSPDPNFEERSTDDPISVDLIGKKVGDKFVLAPGMIDRVGEIAQILPKHVRRFQDSLSEMPVRFPAESSNFQSVQIGGADELDLGFATVLESVRQRADQVKEIQEVYLNQPIPVHLYAQRFGKNAYTAMIHLAETDSVQIKCSTGDPGSFAAAVQMLEAAKSIVLDLSSLATMRLLGVEDLLGTHTFILSQDSALELRETLIDDLADRKSGTMVYQDGRYTMYEETPERRNERIKRDEEFCETVLANVSIKPHLGLASIEAEQRDTLIKFLGQYGTEAVILAMEPDSVLLTDDLTQGELAAAMFGVRRTWMQAFLVSCIRKGKLTQEGYAQAVAKLIGMRYQIVSFDSGVLAEAAKLAGYQPTAWPFAQAAEAFSVVGNSIDQLIRIAIGFFLLLSQQPVVSQQGGRMLGALLEAMWRNPHARRPLLQMRKNSSRIFGLNVVAEAEFNAVFDGWRRGHAQDVI